MSNSRCAAGVHYRTYNFARPRACVLRLHLRRRALHLCRHAPKRLDIRSRLLSMAHYHPPPCPISQVLCLSCGRRLDARRAVAVSARRAFTCGATHLRGDASGSWSLSTAPSSAATEVPKSTVEPSPRFVLAMCPGGNVRSVSCPSLPSLSSGPADGCMFSARDVGRAWSCHMRRLYDANLFSQRKRLRCTSLRTSYERCA